MTREFSRQIFETKSLNIKFHQNSSSESRVVPHGPTEEHEGNALFAILRTRAKMH